MIRSVSMSSPGTYTAVPLTTRICSSAISGHHAFTAAEHLTGVTHHAGHRGCCHHDGAHQHRTAGDGALPADEVAVGAAGTQLVTDQLVRVHRQAHAAAGSAPFETGADEYLVDAALLTFFLDERRAGHRDRLH